jgi:hypothetical protein
MCYTFHICCIFKMTGECFNGVKGEFILDTNVS